MVIQHNLSAMNSHRFLGINNAQTSSNLEKLSSGYKVNRAADDAAGLAISEKMRGQIRGLAMAEQNTSHGVNLIQTAEGGLNETHAILQRMRELAVQSSNGTYQDVDRAQLSKEYEALKSEVDRISESIHYNNIKLLNGNLDEGLTATLVEDKTGMVNKINVNPSVTAGTAIAIDTGTIVKQTEVAATNTQVTITMGITSGTVSAGDVASITVDGVQTFTTSSLSLGATADNIADALVSAITAWDTANGGILSYTAGKGASGEIVLTAKAAGANTIDTLAVTAPTVTGTGNAVITAAPAVTNAGADRTRTDATLTLAKIAGNNATATYDWDTDTFLLTDANGVSAVLENSRIVNQNQTAIYNITGGENLVFQIGANGGQDQRVNLGIADMSSKNIGLKFGDVKSDGSIASVYEAASVFSSSIANIEQANKAIEIIHAATNQVSGQRAELGALQNRLESTLNSLGTAKENLTAAESTIRDTDMAKEMMEFTKNNILTQAAQAMLAQANQLPQGVLQLLR